MKFQLLLLSFLQLRWTQAQLTRAPRALNQCMSSKPCERLCPKTPTTFTKEGRITPQSLSSAVYCIMGKCFCPEKRINTSKCVKASSGERAACSIPSSIAMTITKPVTEKMGKVQLCTIKGQKNQCTKKRDPDRVYCVYTIKTDSSTGMTMVPGFTMPGGMTMPTIPTGVAGMVTPTERVIKKKKGGQDSEVGESVGGEGLGEESPKLEDRRLVNRDL